MQTTPCPTCKRPLPVALSGAVAPCVHCPAPAVAMAASPRATIFAASPPAPRTPPAQRPAPATSLPPAEPKKTKLQTSLSSSPPAQAPAPAPSQSFASALSRNAERVTPVRPFSPPLEAIRGSSAGARRAPVAAVSTTVAPTAVAARAPSAVAAPAPAVLPLAATVFVPAAIAAPPAAKAPSIAAPAPLIADEPLSNDTSNDTPSLVAEIGNQDITATGEPFLPQLRPAPAEAVDLRSGWAAMWRRVPMGGLGATVLSAVLVIALGALGMKLFAKPARPPAAAAARVAGARTVATSAAPGPSAAPVTSPSPHVVVPPAAPPAPAAVAAPAPIAHAAPAAVEPAVAANSDSDDDDGAGEAPPAAKPSPERARHASAPAHAQVASRPSKARAPVNHGSRGSSQAVVRRRVATRSTAPAAAAPPSETDKTQHARESYQRGNEQLFSGDAASAVRAYEEAVRLNPKDPAGYRGLGLAYAQQGRRTEAVRFLKAYLKRARDAQDRALISERIALLGTAP